MSPLAARPLWCSWLIAALACACSTASPAQRLEDSPPLVQPSPPPKAAPPKAVRLIASLEWSAQGRVELLGVDAQQQQARLLIEQHGQPERLILETLELRTGQRLERWEATPEQANKIVNTYPRFDALEHSFERDLVRYAALLRKSGPWSHRSATPPLGVYPSPDGAHILYTTPPNDHSEGDWLMLADAQGKALRRYDPHVASSYRVSISPDSGLVAWMGGSPRYARSGQVVGYVLHLGDWRGAVRAIPAIRDVLRKPLWSQDSQTIYALGHRDARTQCLYALPSDARSPDALYCHEGQLDVIMHPPSGRQLLLLHPWTDSTSAQGTVVLIDSTQGAVLAQHQVPMPQGFGEFGHFLDQDHVALFPQRADTIQILELSSGKILREIELGGTLIGRHTTSVVGQELIVLRRRGERTELIGVKTR